MDTENPIVSKWFELKTLVTNTEYDVIKNAGGNDAAGVRARKGLRQAKKLAAELVEMTVEFDKTRKLSRKGDAPVDPAA